MAAPGPESNVIEVKNLQMGYDGKVVLEQINFSVRRREVFVILGPSGCGKSTLLKHLIGLLRPMAGEVWLEGDNIVTAEGEARQRILRKFGVAYQSGALFGSMTVLENVRLPLDAFTSLPKEARNVVALAKLKQVALPEVGAKMPADLSGGMQKRAALARAMVLDPGIIFLDEPSAGLDPITSAGLDELIKELSHTLGITFVLVTHELASIFNIADRAIMLDGERRTIVAEGKPTELRDHSPDPQVRQFFNRAANPPDPPRTDS
jgi:phospholipid/cholesterol/gamma-HCH transport system ATP-binding protein